MAEESVLRRALASERVRYLLVGAWNTLFGYGVFVGLEAAFGDELHYLGVLVVAHVISVLVAFVGYRRLVFRVTGSVLRDLLRFWSVYLTVFAVNVVALPVLVEAGGLPVVLAQGIFLVLTVIASYVSHKHWSFRR